MCIVGRDSTIGVGHAIHHPLVEIVASHFVTKVSTGKVLHWNIAAIGTFIIQQRTNLKKAKETETAFDV